MIGATNIALILGIAIPVVVVLGLVVLAVAAFRQPRAGVGQLDRMAVKRDAKRTKVEAAKAAAVQRADTDETVVAESTEMAEFVNSPTTGGDLAAVEAAEVIPYAPAVAAPPDPMEVGITRRRVLTRLTWIGGGIGLLTTLAGPALAFLIPAPTKGFGGKIDVSTSASDIKAQIAAKKEPFYVSEARSYIVEYTPTNEKAAAAVYPPAILDAAKETGLMPIYQKCVHLGCKVPWCASSQWFECPCHGSQYNSAGEKRGGPAPRGLDRFAFTANGGKITINTGLLIQGPPIGTDTIGKDAAGPHCV